MPEAVNRKISISPEDYQPEKPAILAAAERAIAQEAPETYVVEGVTFELIHRPKTYFTGIRHIAPDPESEPDTTGYNEFAGQRSVIRDSLTPDCMIVLSVGYRQWNQTQDVRRELVWGQETGNPHQPGQLYVRELPESYYIRVMASGEAWALTKKMTGEEDPQWHMAPLFKLVQTIFCTRNMASSPGSLTFRRRSCIILTAAKASWFR